MGRETDVPSGLGPRDWGSLAGRAVIHLFSQLVQVVFVPLGAVDLAGEGNVWPGGE